MPRGPLAGQNFNRVDTRRLDLVKSELKPTEGCLEHHTAIRVKPAKAPVETLAPDEHEAQRDFRQLAAEPLVILDPGQRTVDSGRTDLQRIGVRYRILDIEKRGNMPAQCLAILNRHLSFRDRLGHDLQLAAATLGTGIADPNKPETEIGYRAFDNLADP